MFGLVLECLSTKSVKSWVCGMNERLKNRRRLKTLQAAAAARICHFYKVLAVKWFEGKMFVFLYNLSVLYICVWRGRGGVARLIYAQYAHLYYYGLWMRSTRINLIESSMCHKNPETEMEEKKKENEREGGRELDWNSSQAKWQLPRPRQVAGQAPSSRRGTNNNNNNNRTLWKVGGNQLTRLIGWLRDWLTDTAETRCNLALSLSTFNSLHNLHIYLVYYIRQKTLLRKESIGAKEANKNKKYKTC